MTALMLAVPPLADVAATLDLADRTEARLRQPGDFPPSSSFDVSTVPEARLTLRLPRFDATMKYEPRLTFWDLNDKSSQPTWLDAGTAHLQWQTSDHVRLTLDEDASQLPGVIRLAFARDARTGRSCNVVWRRGKSAGIKFV